MYTKSCVQILTPLIMLINNNNDDNNDNKTLLLSKKYMSMAQFLKIEKQHILTTDEILPLIEVQKKKRLKEFKDKKLKKFAKCENSICFEDRFKESSFFPKYITACFPILMLCYPFWLFVILNHKACPYLWTTYLLASPQVQ